jgi:flagellar motility protein MotE (MotC chaperone)
VIKSLILILACFCVAVVASLSVGLGLLWSRGQITAHTLRELREVLTGGTVANANPEFDDDKASPQASLDEVINARARMSVEFNAKEAELAIFKQMMAEGTARLTAEKEAFEQRKRAFDEELQRLNETLDSEATGLARGVLLALPPKDAVEKLMQLTTDECVVLLKGMPEKSIAKILKEFQGAADRIERGKQIFDALNRGDPVRPLVERTQGGLNPAPTAAPTDAVPKSAP